MAETSQTPEEDGESKGDKCMDMLHFTCLRDVDTNTVHGNRVTLSGNGFSRHAEYQPGYVCACFRIL